jgi:hypothetical protein
MLKILRLVSGWRYAGQARLPSSSGLVLALLLGLHLPLHAQSTPEEAQRELDELYGEIVPANSVPLRSLSRQNVILPDTRAEEWPEIRQRKKQRILQYWGEGPVPLAPALPRFEELERYENFGLTHIRYRYHVVDDYWNEAILVLPARFQRDGRSRAIVAVHGTNGRVGKYGVIGGGTRENRAYGIELAQRGYVTFSPDQYGFGATLEGTTQEELVRRFYERYPEWSIRALRVLTLIRAIDVLEQLDYVERGGYGTIGNSLGGRSVLDLAAMDSRIVAAVPSTAVTPARTNAHRALARFELEEPKFLEHVRQTRVPPFDVHEVLALCAPRAVLVLEPFNDPYNVTVLTSFESVYSAYHAYRLLGVPERISIVVHGDGHDTRPDVRTFAYAWFDRFLLGQERSLEMDRPVPTISRGINR